MKRYLLGVFQDEHEMLHAAQEFKKSKVVIHDIYTTFPVHGLDEVLSITRSRLPYVAAIAGSIGLTVALYFQYWVSAINWPINVGGKPFNSFAAFIPVAFEITVLFGAFTTVFAFLFRSKLIPALNDKVFHPGATQDKFVIAFALNDASIDTHTISKTLTSLGACEVEIREV